MPRQEPGIFSRFQWWVLIPGVMWVSARSAHSRQDVSDNSVVIPYTGVQSNSAIPVGCHITNSGREYLPSCDWMVGEVFINNIVWWATMKNGAMVVSCDFYNFIVLGKSQLASPVWRMWSNSPYWLLIECMEAGDGTLVPRPRWFYLVVIWVAALIFYSSFLPNLLLQTMGEIEPPFNVMFFSSSLAQHDLLKMWH